MYKFYPASLHGKIERASPAEIERKGAQSYYLNKINVYEILAKDFSKYVEPTQSDDYFLKVCTPTSLLRKCCPLFG